MTSSTQTQSAGTVEESLRALFAGDRALVADPAPIFAEVRAAGPVLRMDDYVVVSRHRDIEAILNDPRARVEYAYADALLAATPPEDRWYAQELLDFFARWLAQSNDAEHDRLRRLVHLAFSPRTVAALAVDVDQILDSLLDDLAIEEHPDVVTDLGYHLPLLVICRILDIPVEDRFAIHEHSIEFMKFIVGAADVKQSHHAMTQLTTLIGDRIESRRGQPTTPLLQQLFDAEADGERLSTDDLVMLTVNLVFGGHDTTTNVVGNGLLALLSHPDQWQLLVSRPDLARAATEELLRFASPVPEIHRTFGTDVEVNGLAFAAGEHLRLLLGSANTDPQVYPDPQTLDITREGLRHLTFGQGPHYCLGQALTRLEITSLLTKTTARFPQMRLAGEPVWKPFYALRGLESLPVDLGLR
jgi:cytochrome P450